MFEEVFTVLVLIVFVLGLAAIVTRIWGTPRVYSLPPSVPGKLPIVGNAQSIDLSKLHLILDKWSKQIGGVFRFSLYGKDIVVLSSYEAIYEALVERGRDFAGRPTMYRTGHAARHKHSIVWQTYTPKLQLLRKHVQRYVKVYGTGMDLLEDRCKPEIQQLIQRFRDRKMSAFDPLPNIYSAVCNVMILILLGKRLDYDDLDFQKVIEINELFNRTYGPGEGQKLDYLPLSQLGGDAARSTLQKALRLRDEFFEKQIQILKSKTGDLTDCIVGSLLATSIQHSEPDVGITENTVKEVFTNLLLAGTDTTATALNCLLLLLANYPHVQQRLHEEMDQLITQPRLPGVSDKQAMPYMEAVLMELLRFISHVPLAVPHCSIKDTHVQGFHIPVDTTVYINLWSLHHDASFWEEPWVFRPERFLDESGKLLSPDKPNRRRLLAFGAGRRVCLGETLAKNRLFLFAAALVQNFLFEADEASPFPVVDPRSFSLGLVLHPGTFKVKAIPRVKS